MKQRTHCFVWKQQEKFIRSLKADVPLNCVVIGQDYAENYNIFNQNEIQQAHFNKLQISMLTCRVKMNIGGEVVAQSIVVLSDCKDHNTPGAYTAYQRIFEFVRSNMKEIKYCWIITDGCTGSFKNCKQMANLAKHFEDFGCHASWVYSASCHGKNEIDGVYI